MCIRDRPVSVGDLFAGALLPGLMLVGMYILYQLIYAVVKPESSPPIPAEEFGEGSLLPKIMHALIPPVVLIVSVLGSILGGVATPTEAAAVGAMGATLLAGLRVQELKMPRILEINTPDGLAKLSRLAGAALGGFLTFMLLGSILYDAALISGLVGMVVVVVATHRHIFRNILKALDNGSNAPIYLSALALVVMLFLSAFVDMRILRNEIPASDMAAIFAASICGIIVIWGLLVLSLIHI